MEPETENEAKRHNLDEDQTDEMSKEIVFLAVAFVGVVLFFFGIAVMGHP